MSSVPKKEWRKKEKLNETSLIEVDFSQCDLLETTFHNCNLSKSNFSNATNYSINSLMNNVKKAKFSYPEATRLLKGLGIIIV